MRTSTTKSTFTWKKQNRAWVCHTWCLTNSWTGGNIPAKFCIMFSFSSPGCSQETFCRLMNARWYVPRIPHPSWCNLKFFAYMHAYPSMWTPMGRQLNWYNQSAKKWCLVWCQVHSSRLHLQFQSPDLQVKHILKPTQWYVHRGRSAVPPLISRCKHQPAKIRGHCLLRGTSWKGHRWLAAGELLVILPGILHCYPWSSLWFYDSLLPMLTAISPPISNYQPIFNPFSAI